MSTQHSPGRRWMLGLAGLGLYGLSGTVPAAGEDAPGAASPPVVAVTEDLRPMLVYKLVKFIDWPAAAMGELSDNFRVCVLGPPLLERTFSVLKTRQLHQRGVEVQQVQTPLTQPLRCHVLFIDAGLTQIAEVLKQVATLPVLTVSDQVGFASSQGMIGLSQNQQRVGFEINLNVAKATGLHIRAPLLELANLVGGSR